MSALLLFARRYWRVLAIAAAVGVTLYGFTRMLDEREQRGYKRATAEMAERVAKANESARAAERAAQSRTDEVARHYEQSIQMLDGRYRAAADQLRRVRICPSAVRVPSAAQPAAGTDAPARDHGLPAAVAVDTRVDRLILLARDADGCAARLTALQEWVRVALLPSRTALSEGDRTQSASAPPHQ